MPVFLVALLAFLGCISISTSSVFAEATGQKLTATIENFNQLADTDESDDDGVEPEGGSCGECYPPPK